MSVVSKVKDALDGRTRAAREAKQAPHNAAVTAAFDVVKMLAAEDAANELVIGKGDARIAECQEARVAAVESGDDPAWRRADAVLKAEIEKQERRLDTRKSIARRLKAARDHLHALTSEDRNKRIGAVVNRWAEPVKQLAAEATALAATFKRVQAAAERVQTVWPGRLPDVELLAHHDLERALAGEFWKLSNGTLPGSVEEYFRYGEPTPPLAERVDAAVKQLMAALERIPVTHSVSVAGDQTLPTQENSAELVETPAADAAPAVAASGSAPSTPSQATPPNGKTLTLAEAAMLHASGPGRKRILEVKE